MKKETYIPSKAALDLAAQFKDENLHPKFSTVTEEDISFSCNVCSAVFSEALDLYNHKREAHSN